MSRHSTSQTCTLQHERKNLRVAMDLQARTLTHVARAKLERGPIGRRGKALRATLGWTQQTLAERAGIERTEITRLETGGNLATSAALRASLARGFELHYQTMADYLDGAQNLADTRGRVG